jgi:hypothetical protein
MASGRFRFQGIIPFKWAHVQDSILALHAGRLNALQRHAQNLLRLLWQHSCPTTLATFLPNDLQLAPSIAHISCATENTL